MKRCVAQFSFLHSFVRYIVYYLFSSLSPKFIRAIIITGTMNNEQNAAYFFQESPKLTALAVFYSIFVLLQAQATMISPTNI